MNIDKYSIGIGGRIGKEGVAHLRALQRAKGSPRAPVPVWNKSFREHSLIGTNPDAYETLVEIDRAELPAPTDVEAWTAEELVKRLRHEPGCPDLSVHVRQLMHVAFEIAGEMGGEFRDALDAAHETVAACVTENLYERHVRPLLVGP